MQSEKINDLIFKELLKRGYSLEGNTRIWNIADSKLWYLTPKQAQAYLDLEKSSEYNTAVNKFQSEELMKKNASQILKELKDETAINIVDLGCGDGKKAAELVKKFPSKIKIRYCPIDISSFMVEKAIQTFSQLNLGEIIEFQYNISDFENLENVTPLLRKGQFRRNLFLLLGNTLGNFEITDLLYAIRGSMETKDLLLVDTAVADEKITEKAELQSKNKLVEEFLIQITSQIGLKREDVEYGARFKNQRVEFFFAIKNNKKIKFQDKTINFNIGDQIIVAIAYKHNIEDLKTYFNIYFTKADILLSNDKSQAFILCQK